MKKKMAKKKKKVNEVRRQKMKVVSVKSSHKGENLKNQKMMKENFIQNN